MTKIAFIASHGHSGSTLLDLMIGSHSRCFSIGEIKSLNRFATLQKHIKKRPHKPNLLGNRCACGAETIYACPIWSKVNEEIQAEAGLSLVDLDVNAADAATFQRHNEMLYRAIAKISGAHVIVDSSKSTVRLAGLLRTPGLEVMPVHLVRHPRGVVNSHIRNPLNSFFDGVASYNVVTLRIQRILLGVPHITVHYEEMVANTEATLTEVMDGIGLEFEPGQLDWAGHVHHNLGGNGPVLTARDSTLRYDSSWRTEMSVLKRVGVDLLTAPAGAANAFGRVFRSSPSRSQAKSRRGDPSKLAH